MRLQPRPRVKTAAFIAALAALACAFSVPSARAATQTGGPCSTQTAQKLEPDKVSNVVCGAFAGPGSTAMVVNVTNGTCMPFLGWDAFVLTGGNWTRLPLGAHGGFTGYPVVAVGNDLKETLMVPKPGQPICLASTSRSRIWRWNGNALVTGPWTYSKSADNPSKPSGGQTGTLKYISSPTGSIQCALGGANGGVYCQTFEPDQHVSMDAHGKLDICHKTPNRGCAGNAGEDVHFTTIPYGSSFSLGGVRCSSAFTGMTCVITATGRGFLIARQAIKRFG